MTKKEKELLERALPKWCKMYVTGIPIEKEQALEIIRRTDTFFNGYNGNNRKLETEIERILEFPNSIKIEDFLKFSKKQEKWKKLWKYIELEYVSNSWISTSYFYGANGWCHPDGIIGYSENIGKYPDIKTVYKDWKKIIKEFPFLELGVTLYNGEHCEEDISPVVSFKIKDGIINIIDPKDEDVHKEHTFESCQEYLKKTNLISSKGFTYTEENAIPLEIIEKWKDNLNKKD